jgi:cytoskeletal protein CcmA (bactofilin family)
MEKDNAAESTSLLSKNVKIEGEIQGPENLHIEGYIKGSIKLSGDVFVGNTGIVEADVEAKNIVKLIGDCSAASIDIKEGAVFEGRSNMIKSPGASAGSRPTPAISTAQATKQPKH